MIAGSQSRPEATPASDASRPPWVGGDLVRVEDVAFAYPGHRFRLHVPELTVRTGESIALTGPSGCGKTTLVNLIGGILVPESGVVRFEERPVSSLSDRLRRDFRIRSIGFLFQDFGLLDYLTAEENILLPYFVNRTLHLDAEARRRARTLAERLEVGGCLTSLPSHLSQGERQRIALCRALITDPRLIIADEPTGNLDAANAVRTVALLLEAVGSTGASLIAVTHDRTITPRFDREVRLPDILAPSAGPDPSAGA